MDPHLLCTQALDFETRIRDLYRSAEATIDDPRGQAIFRALANDEQSHIDFLRYSIGQLAKQGDIDLSRLATPLPAGEEVKSQLDRLQAQIPRRMLGDVKTVLNQALQLEKETSDHYRKAASQASGNIQELFSKFLEIEERHLDLVQIELDHASNNGMWFDFMEIDLEQE